MTTAYSTMNASFAYLLKEEELALFIKAGVFPDEYAGHIYVFFTEISISVISKFMKEQNVTHDELEKYYHEFIKPIYTNPDLEEMLTLE